VNQMFSYVIGILIAGLIVFGLHFGMQVASPASARQINADRAAEKTLEELDEMVFKGTRTQQLAAITAIGQGDNQLDERVALLARAMVINDRSIQSIAELAIQRLGDRAKPSIRKLLESSDAETVRSACGVIKALGVDGDEYAPEVLKLLAEGDEFDRHAALYAMQTMSPEVIVTAVDDVIKQLDDKDFNTQCQACFVLRQMGNGAAPATERLVQLMQEGNVSTRSRAAQALGAIGPVDGFDVPGLVAGLLSAPPYIEKTRALDALGDLGPEANRPEIVEKIQKLIDNANFNCMAHANLALYRVTGEKDQPLRRLQDLLQIVDYRTSAMESLGAMGADAASAVPKILEYLTDEDLAVVETSVLALKNIGPPAKAALPRLEKMLNHDDFLVSVAAKEAIESISRDKSDN